VSDTIEPPEDLKHSNRVLLVAQAAAKIRGQAKERVVDDDASSSLAYEKRHSD
jgi:hypothetical protein